MDRSYYAIFTMVGTIIGAGIFGLPYVAAKAGFVVALVYIAVLTVAVTLLHLLYGEVVLRTKGKHRLVGYAGIYLGEWGRMISSFSVIVGTYAAMLAYIILGGDFLHQLMGRFFGGTDLGWGVVFFLFSSIFISKGLKMVSWAEMLLSSVMLGAILVFLFKGIFLIDAANYNWNVDIGELFLPYGVILFALGGVSVIPDIAGILDRQKSQLKRSIVWGTLIPASIYLLFITVIYGVSGQNTSENAISGLMQYYGDGIIILGALIGFLAVITSFLAFGINLKKTFEYDYKFTVWTSFFLALSVPFILFLLGVDNFIRIIGFAGGVTGGIDGIIIMLMYRKADKNGRRKPEYDIITSRPVEFLMIAMFVAGIFYTIIGFLK